jgi:hypothetical protein
MKYNYKREICTVLQALWLAGGTGILNSMKLLILHVMVI